MTHSQTTPCTYWLAASAVVAWSAIACGTPTTAPAYSVEPGPDDEAAALEAAKRHPIAAPSIRPLYPEQAPPAAEPADNAPPQAAGQASSPPPAAEIKAPNVIAPAPPPATKYESTLVAPPAPNSVWAPGYWYWLDGRYVWVPGDWLPTRPGFVYVAPAWSWTAAGWRFSIGGWAPIGSRVVIYPVYARRYHDPIWEFRPRGNTRWRALAPSRPSYVEPRRRVEVHVTPSYPGRQSRPNTAPPAARPTAPSAARPAGNDAARAHERPSGRSNQRATVRTRR